MRWNFRSTFIEKEHDGRAIALDVLYYNCRFKRSVAPVVMNWSTTARTA